MRSAAGAVIGGAAVGVAGHLAKRHSGPKLLGVRIPNELNPKRLDVSKVTKGLDVNGLATHLDVKKLGRNVDVKDVIRQLGNFAEQVEARSEEVHTLSGQAKRLTRRIS